MSTIRTVVIFIAGLLPLIGSSQTIEDILLDNVGFSKIELLTKKDTITFLITKNDLKKPKPVIVFLQGSLPIPIIQNHQKTIFPFEIKPYVDLCHFVIIARKGVLIQGDYDENEKISDEYHQNNNLYYRVNQVDEVIHYLRKQEFVDKSKIYVIGHSEGYRVGAKLAENNTDIAKLVCMSADPFNRSTEMILRERIKCFDQKNDSISNQKIDDYIRNYENKEEYKKQNLQNINFMNWYSYESELAYKSLEKYNAPILVVYGTNDIGSTNNYLLPYLLPNADLTLKSYSDYGHNYEKEEFDKEGNQLENSWHWDDVFKDVSEWLLSE
ncbi:MAG: hypothetical protein H6584_02685 [Flavobacteriales bacterium]|nr:hypothetical protein [Flavobacteriales bacterium]